MNNDIINQYLNADFGFSAVDEPPRKEEQPDPIQEDVSGLKDNIERIEHNVNDILTAINALTTRLSDLDDEFDVVKTSTEQEVKDRLIQVEKMIMPLLVNFLKTADKDYLYWPNRTDAVQGMIDKLLAVTRGE